MDELPGSVMLDAEVTGQSFQSLMTQVNRRSDVDTAESRLALFDIVPLADFRTGKCDIPQVDRHGILAGLAPMIQRVSNGLIYVVPKVLVDLDTPEGQDSFTQFNRDAIEAGYEGIMVKDPRAPYETKRTTAWLKIKPFIEVSLEVIGFEEGDREGKYRGTLGALVCQGEDDGDKIKVKVGSGLTDEMRKKIWENPDAFLGLIAEIRADAKTLERGSEVYSLRFPRFKAFRGFVPGEKL
jgi:DNA ligase-1